MLTPKAITMRRFVVMAISLIVLTSGCTLSNFLRQNFLPKPQIDLPTNLNDLPAQGYLDFPTIGGDAGFLDLQAGDTITIKWIDGPTTASKVLFVLQDENFNKTIVGEDTNPADGISIQWQIPAHLDGDLFAVAYEKSTLLRSETAGTLGSGDLPPAGRCVISASSIGSLTIYDNPTDENIIGSVNPGVYAAVLQTKSDGWIQIDTSTATMDESASTGWIAPETGFHFSGPCPSATQMHIK